MRSTPPLRAVFLGHDFSFNRLLVHWLAQRIAIVGVVWIDAVQWKRSISGHLEFLRRRVRRRGFVRALDEAAYYAWHRAFLWKRHQQEVIETLIDPYLHEHGSMEVEVPTHYTNDPNGLEARTFLSNLSPDVGFAECIHTYLEREIRSIPRLGIFLWHDGITPEYKGLYAPFWALYNDDPEHVGYTLLRVDDRLDAGEIYVQGAVELPDASLSNFSLLSHFVILRSLPAVQRFLVDLHAGTARPIDRDGAVPHVYTYPGFTDYVRARKKFVILRAGRIRGVGE